jgi:hypothetical protein
VGRPRCGLEDVRMDNKEVSLDDDYVAQRRE